MAYKLPLPNVTVTRAANGSLLDHLAVRAGAETWVSAYLLAKGWVLVPDKGWVLFDAEDDFIGPYHFLAALEMQHNYESADD